jgi:2-polyprenyl-6-methoxyphenol hydroxylase-like FAD-dependent oxidoreductase
MPPKVTILGGGIFSLTLSRALRVRGIPSIIYEKPARQRKNDFGVTLHPSYFEPLLKVLNMDHHTFREKFAVDASVGGMGAVSPKHMVQLAGLESGSFRARRGELERFLRRGNYGGVVTKHYHHDQELATERNRLVQKVEKLSDGGWAIHFVTGPKVHSKYVIVADGVGSPTRKLVSSQNDINILPYVACTGKRWVSQHEYVQILAKNMWDSNVVELLKGGYLLQIAMNKITDERALMNWIISRPARENDSLLGPDRRTIAARIREEIFSEVTAFRDLISPWKEVFDMQRLKDNNSYHILMSSFCLELPEVQRLNREGLFLVGDTIHAEPILGGQGWNQSLRDAVLLADVIAEKGFEGVGKWIEESHEGWKTGVEESERLLRLMHGI